MKNKIKSLVLNYIKDFQKKEGIKTEWKDAIIKFADAGDPLFLKLKDVVRSTHALPADFLKEAKTVITFFIPFEEWIAESNIEGKYSSKKWARAYVETNELIDNLNVYIKNELIKMEYKVAIIPATHDFDKKSLKSDWSHRHAAYIAGVGTFGINNMLITEKGCCGRIGSIITNLDIEASQSIEKENCLNKSGTGCKICVERCVNNSLALESFDRKRCYRLLLENDKFHSEMGLTDACGKCCVDLPCSFVNPNSKNQSE